MMFSPIRGSVFALCCTVLFACSVPAPSALAGPAGDELGDLAEPLGTEVTTEFLESPLHRVVEYLQREASTMIALDASVTIEDTPISLKADAMTVREVLDLIALTTDLDWAIEGGVVFISTDNAVIERRVVSRSYNLRGLMVLVPNFTNSPRMELNEGISNTNSGGGGDGSGLFSDDSDVRNVGSNQEFMDMIVELIQDATGSDPGYWLDEIFTVRSIQGMLVVRATPEVHEQIEDLLTQLDKSLALMLAVEAHYLVVPRSMIEDLEGGYILNKEQCDAFVQGLDNNNVRTLGSMRTVCHNGQRIFTFAGKNEGFISDVEPIPDTTSVDPTVSVARSGVTTDLVPTVAFDGEYIEVAVRSDMVHASEIETTPVPVVSVAGAGAEVENAAVGEVEVGLVNQQLTRFRTNARVKNGGGVILTASTNVFDDIDADQFEVVLLVRTHILTEDGEEDVE